MEVEEERLGGGVHRLLPPINQILTFSKRPIDQDSLLCDSNERFPCQRSTTSLS